MIKQIWFDFGNIFIPIFPERTQESFEKRGVQLSKPDFQILNEDYEIGALSIIPDVHHGWFQISHFG